MNPGAVLEVLWEQNGGQSFRAVHENYVGANDYFPLLHCWSPIALTCTMEAFSMIDDWATNYEAVSPTRSFNLPRR